MRRDDHLHVDADRETGQGDATDGPGTLYVCGTPIGNLEDVTVRALRVLREVDVVAAEDTRRTAKLLAHYEIKARMVSCHEHNESVRASELLELLRSGRDVALVSDAGMPGISDPGARLIARALSAGIDVVPVPGPSALLAAIVVSGFDASEFTFVGFLPRKGRARREALERLAGERRVIVVYESPYRLRGTLADLARVMGADRRVAVARELTKIHEEVVRGTFAEVLGVFETRPIKGEVTIVVDAPARERGASDRARNQAGDAPGDAPADTPGDARSHATASPGETQLLRPRLRRGSSSRPGNHDRCSCP